MDHPSVIQVQWELVLSYTTMREVGLQNITLLRKIREKAKEETQETLTALEPHLYKVDSATCVSTSEGNASILLFRGTWWKVFSRFPCSHCPWQEHPVLPRGSFQGPAIIGCPGASMTIGPHRIPDFGIIIFSASLTLHAELWTLNTRLPQSHGTGLGRNWRLNLIVTRLNSEECNADC
ncbi:hypothetical protein J1N35_024394 [Gossypium stocksii]|uniref:Uncharacterized protein n=1 Tax=Gossypium stocksii TaxID=47602 RepID=A0A9D3V5H8_9ROSI|nr:hypothetical protein J1N35_024394 [Gossypium stocksii]